jgi:two-component system, OmpR family, response regulator
VLATRASVTTVQSGLIRTLLVEDDDRLATLTAGYLERHNVLVTCVSDGTRGLGEALKNRYDVILLDIMLPGLDGLEICREIRARSNVPIIMLTARGEEPDRVLGLEFGADDYVAKPFSSRELLARIRAQARRARGEVGPVQRHILVGPLKLDCGCLEASVEGRSLGLTPFEFAILRALAENAGRVLSRERLMELAGNAEEAFDRVIDVHISRVRQKLGDDPKNPQFLKTIRGAGYLFVRPGHS